MCTMKDDKAVRGMMQMSKKAKPSICDIKFQYFDDVREGPGEQSQHAGRMGVPEYCSYHSTPQKVPRLTPPLVSNIQSQVQTQWSEIVAMNPTPS